MSDEMRQPFGCYGLRLTGLGNAHQHLVLAEQAWPELTVRRHELTGSVPSELRITESAAVLPLSDGQSFAELDRATGVVDVSLGKSYADEELLHPLLSSTFAVTNWWHGREVFHSGAFAVGGAAWAVIGERGMGKSSTLGYLAMEGSAHGIQVLTDDVVVEDGGDVLAGPAFIDLRPDASVALAGGRTMGHLGTRERARLDIPTPPRRVPLAGWLTLAWGETTTLEPVSTPDRVRALLANRAVMIPPAHPASVLRLAALPFHTLRRPRDWGGLPGVLELIGRLPSCV